MEAFTNETLQAEAKAATSNPASKNTVAAQKEFTGTIQSITERTGVDGKVIEMKSLEGETKSFIVNTSQLSWTGFKDIVEGADFTFTVEERIAGKTTWTNKSTGQTGTHTVSGFSVLSVKKAFKREVGMKMLEDKMMQIFQKSEGDVALTQAFGSAFAAFLK